MRVHIISRKIWAKLGGQSRWVVLNTHPHPHTSSLFDAMMMTTTMLIKKMSKMHKSKHISMHRWYNKASPPPPSFTKYTNMRSVIMCYDTWVCLNILYEHLYRIFSTYIEMRTNAVFIVNVLLFCMLLDYCTFNAKPLSKCRYFFFFYRKFESHLLFFIALQNEEKNIAKKKHDRK